MGSGQRAAMMKSSLSDKLDYANARADRFAEEKSKLTRELASAAACSAAYEKHASKLEGALKEMVAELEKPDVGVGFDTKGWIAKARILLDGAGALGETIDPVQDRPPAKVSATIPELRNKLKDAAAQIGAMERRINEISGQNENLRTTMESQAFSLTELHQKLKAKDEALQQTKGIAKSLRDNVTAISGDLRLQEDRMKSLSRRVQESLNASVDVVLG